MGFSTFHSLCIFVLQYPSLPRREKKKHKKKKVRLPLPTDKETLDILPVKSPQDEPNSPAIDQPIM